MKQIDLLRKQLYYQSHHRGMKEMDLILGGFAQQHLPTLTRQELLQFEELLTLSDQKLYGWLFEKSPLSSDVSENLIKMITGYMNNK